MFASALGVFFLDGVGSGTRKRPPGTILGIPFLAFGVVDNTKRVLDLSWSQDQRPDASSRVCVGSPGRPWSVPWSVPGGGSVASPERHLERNLRRPWSVAWSVTWSVT